MGDATARVYRLDPGSVLVIEGAVLPPSKLDQFTEELAEACGHHQFVVLALPPPGTAQVIPAEGLLGWLATQGITVDGGVLRDDRPPVVPSGTTIEEGP